MRRLAVLLFAALTAQSYALTLDDLAHSFRGTGSWKSSRGELGTYEAKLRIEKLREDVCGVTESIIADGRTYDFQYRLYWRNNAHDFFDVFAYGRRAGEGYCFSSDAGVTCHLEYSVLGTHVEQSVMFPADGQHAHRLGSKVVRGRRTAWHDSLTADSDEGSDQR